MNNENRTPLVIRTLLVIIGWLAVVLGVIGIFLPLLPTTPFLLLAASCFAKSSSRFHHWLLNQPYLGPYIQLYLDGKGIPNRAKFYILLAMWLSMGFTTVYFVPYPAVKIVLLLIACAVSVYILRLPTLAIEHD